jgi:glycosyltransferase involved in cell wall biosynthesis
MLPLVSIIIPVMNGEKTIKRAINSCLNQLYKRLEIIIVLNNSNVKTKNIVYELSARDNRLTVIDLPISGRSMARNVGIRFASGKYIQFLDSDDTIRQDKIKKSVKFLEKNPDFFAYCSNVDYFNDKAKKRMKNSFFNSQLNELFYGNIFAINSVVFKNNGIKYFIDDIEYNEDWFFWVLNLSDKLVQIDEFYIGGTVHITGSNSMKNTGLMISTSVYVRALIIKMYKKKLSFKGIKNDLRYMLQFLSIDEKYRKNNKFIVDSFKLYYIIALSCLKIPIIKKIWKNKMNTSLLNIYI